MDNPTSSTPAPGPAPAPQAGFFAAIRRTGLYRSDERWIGGVCGGLAARFGVDPLLVRGIVAVTVLLGGFGLVLYAVAWALLPEQRDGRIHLEGLTLGHPDIALLGALVMLVVGLGRGPLFGIGMHVPGWLQAMFWVAAVVGAVVLIATAASNRTPPRPPSPYGPFPGGPVPPAGGPVPPAGPVPPVPPTYGTPPASAATSGYGPAAHVPAPGGPGPATYGGPAHPTAPAAAYPPPGPYGPYPAGSYPAGGGRGPAYPPQPPYGPAPRRPAPAPVPVYPSPVRRSAGLPLVGSVVALGLLTLAGLLIAHRTDTFTGPVVATAAGVTVVLAGLATIGAGLRGRRSGGLTAVAIVALVIAGPAALGERSDWTSPALSHAQQVNGSSNVTLSDRESASRGVRVGVGDSRIDLSGVPMDSSTLEVPLWLAVGNYTVVVPRGTAVSATVDLGAGSVQWRLDGDDQRADGVGISQRTFTNPAAESGTAQLHLRISMGTGDLTIIEEQS